VTGLTENELVNGAVNKLENKLTTQVNNAVNCTVNPDKTFLLNGTTSAWTDFAINSPYYLANGHYKFSIGNALPSDVFAMIYGYDGSQWVLVASIATGGDTEVTFDATSAYQYYTVQISIRANTQINNVTIKPMICVPDYNGGYVPYAKSNRELTEDVALNSYQPTIDGFKQFEQRRLSRVGAIKNIAVNAYADGAKTAETALTLCYIEAEYRPTNGNFSKEILIRNGVNALLYINATNGKVELVPRQAINDSTQIAFNEFYI
jgi:hypothetical protein